MKKKNDIEVIINNKRVTISGYESAEYLQKVASYINGKYLDFKSKDCFGRLETDLRSVLIEINIADEYFKSLKDVQELEEEGKQKSKDIFDMKHEVIGTQTKLEEILKELEASKAAYNEAQKYIVKLETELEENKKHQRK